MARIILKPHSRDYVKFIKYVFTFKQSFSYGCVIKCAISQWKASMYKVHVNKHTWWVHSINLIWGLIMWTHKQASIKYCMKIGLTCYYVSLLSPYFIAYVLSFVLYFFFMNGKLKILPYLISCLVCVRVCILFKKNLGILNALCCTSHAYYYSLDRGFPFFIFFLFYLMQSWLSAYSWIPLLSLDRGALIIFPPISFIHLSIPLVVTHSVKLTYSHTHILFHLKTKTKPNENWWRIGDFWICYKFVNVATSNFTKYTTSSSQLV